MSQNRPVPAQTRTHLAKVANLMMENVKRDSRVVAPIFRIVTHARACDVPSYGIGNRLRSLR